MAAGRPFHLTPHARLVGSSLWRYAGSLLPGCILLIGLGWLLQLAAMRALGSAGPWLGNALWAVCWSSYSSLARRAARNQPPRLVDALAPLSRPLSHLTFGLLATSGASLFGFGVLITAAPLALVPLHLGDGVPLGQAIRLSIVRALDRPGRTALACLGFVAFNLLGSAGLIWGLLFTIPLSALALAHAHESPDVRRPTALETSRRSRGITLVETLICIALVCILATSVASHYMAPLAEASAAALRGQIAGTVEPQRRDTPRDPTVVGGSAFDRGHGAASKLTQIEPPYPCTALGNCPDSDGNGDERPTFDTTSSVFWRVGAAILDSPSWVRGQMRSLGQRVQAGVQALEALIEQGQHRGRQQTDTWVRRFADVPVLGSFAHGYAWLEDQQRQFGAGVLKGVVNIVGGSLQVVVDPISTLEGVAALVTSSEARAAVVRGLREPYEKAWAAGNYAEIPGRLLVDVGSIFYAGPKLSSTLGQVTRMRRLEPRGPQASARHTPQPEPKCFGAGTPVLTPSGLQPIELIEEGDWVYARDTESAEVAPKRVLATHVTPLRTLVEVSVGGGATRLRATPGHPFWVEGSGWTAAADLAPGTPLSGLSPSAAAAGSTVLRGLAADGVAELVGQHTVYNLTVEDFETYFVGELGVWVHNTGPRKSCTKPEPTGTSERGKPHSGESTPGAAEPETVAALGNMFGMDDRAIRAFVNRSKNEGIDAQQLANEMRAWKAQKESGVPFGFADAEHFGHFKEHAERELRKLKPGSRDTTAFLQGSAASGIRHKEQLPFGAASDFDVALVGENIFKAGEQLRGVTIQRNPMRIGPLSAGQTEALGLAPLRDKLLEVANNREVNFMLFKNEKAALGPFNGVQGESLPLRLKKGR